MIDNAVLVSSVQQSDSVIHLHIYMLLPILLSLRSVQSIELSAPLYSTGNSAHILLNCFPVNDLLSLIHPGTQCGAQCVVDTHV